MSTLMSAMLTLMSNDLDDNWASTTTSAGDTAKQYLQDDALYEKTADWIDNGMVVYLALGPTGAGTAETRILDKLDGNKLYPKLAFSAQVVTANAYEVHRLFTRTQKLVALRQAAALIFPEYFATIRDTSFATVDNQYEFDISSLYIHDNRPHQVLLSQNIIRDKWAVGTAYVADDYVRPTTLAKFTGYVYKCTIAGTSHATTEPTWPTTIGATVTESGSTVTWECQSELDYSNYPSIPLHDWDITPDGRLLLNCSYDAGYTLTIVGIKPLAFSGSGASETIALDSPCTLVLSAAAIVWLCQQKISSAGNQDVARWTSLKQIWEAELALRKMKYPMKSPDGTILSGPGLTT